MMLYLVRHAESAHSPRWRADSERPLSPRGRQQQIVASKRMKNLGFKINEAWVSPFKRARETLSIIMKEMDLQIPVEVLDALRVSGDHEMIISKIHVEEPRGRNKGILIVGHNPNITRILVSLVGEKAPRMGTSDLAYVLIEDGQIQLAKYYQKGALVLL
ncbi:hypothetical protein GF325_00480 [Candidatus Bathyarchaeota archaeon]|nr:hypothetical protein [Candidatus Bathyarchaeota archaeon]